MSHINFALTGGFSNRIKTKVYLKHFVKKVFCKFYTSNNKFYKK